MGPGDVAIIPGGIPHRAEVSWNEQVETFDEPAPRPQHPRSLLVREERPPCRSEQGHVRVGRPLR
jgi:hypothetical protein